LERRKKERNLTSRHPERVRELSCSRLTKPALHGEEKTVLNKKKATRNFGGGTVVLNKGGKQKGNTHEKKGNLKG